MTEQDLIKKIQELRQIKPNQNWVFLTKTRILGQAPVEVEKSPAAASIISVLRIFFLKPAYAGLVAVFVIFGIFGFSQNSLPGDLLYSFKKITERAQSVFVSQNEKPQLSLELVSRRLAELTRIVDDNQTYKLASAIREFQQSVSEAANNFAASDPEAVKKVVEIRKKTEELQSRGVVIGQEGLQKMELGSLVKVLEDLISDLENRTLTQAQEDILAQMKELIEEGNYSEALELYLINQ